MQNRIHNLATKVFRNETGEFPAIVLGIELHDPSAASRFFDDVIEQFKAQRMCSPPETANMVVTLTGSVAADEFRAHWIARCETDPALKYFTSLFVRADVLHIRGSEVLDQSSLID